MKKILFFLFAIIIAFSSVSVSAEEITITANDLNVSESAILPTSPFYFFKEMSRQIQLALTFNPIQKAELKLKFSSEKLVEAKQLSSDKKEMETALSGYVSSLNELKEYASTLKKDSDSNKNLLKEVALQTLNQQKYLDQLAEKEADSTQKVYESKEKAIGLLTETSLELGSADKIKEALEAATTISKDQNNAIGVLQKVESIVPEQAKKAIIEVESKLIEKRLSDSGLSEDDISTLNGYLEKLKTKTEYKDLISEEYLEKLATNNNDLFQSLGNISAEDRFKLVEYGEMLLSNGNVDYQQVLNELFSLNVSSDAKKVVDEIQSAIANRYSEGGITCLDVDNVICGTDNKTYNNICEAKKVGVEVQYQGRCGSCIAEGKTLTSDKSCCPGYQSCQVGTKNVCKKTCEQAEGTVCTADWTPVCGDNGKTYSNLCFLNKAGIALNHKGECNGNETKPKEVEIKIEEPVEEKTQIANPASAFCVKQGYTLEIRTDADGGQYGVCIFPDSNECEEWQFFRLECGKEYIVIK